MAAILTQKIFLRDASVNWVVFLSTVQLGFRGIG